MAAATHKEFTYWVLPAEPVKSRLKAIIGDLNRQFAAIDFDPHCTFFCSRSGEDEARHFAKHIAMTFKPFDMEVEGLAQSSLLTKTFYVQMRESPELRRMYEALRQDVSGPVDYVLNPHISPLYQFIDEAQRQDLCRRIKIPAAPYRFDCLRVIELDIPIEDLRPMREWRVIANYPLACD